MQSPDRVSLNVSDVQQLLNQANRSFAIDTALLNRVTADFEQQRALDLSRQETPHGIHWNPGSKLPLVGVKLMIKLSPGVHAICQRNEWAESKDPLAIKYVLENGAEIHGKYEWTYL